MDILGSQIPPRYRPRKAWRRRTGVSLLALALFLPASRPAWGASASWNVDADGNWNNSANWTAAFPNNNGSVATFGNIITANRTIALGQNIAVRAVAFNAQYGYTFSAGSTLTIDGGATDFSQSGSGAVTLNVAVTLNRSHNWVGDGTGIVTVNSVMNEGAQSSTLTKSGASAVLLNGANTFTGGITMQAGTLEFGSNTAAGTGTLTLSGGTIQAGGGARTLTNAVTIGGDFTVGGSNALTFSGATSLGAAVRTVTATNTGGTTVSGVLSGAGGGLTKNGAGTLTLTGANTFTGATVISGGTLAANGDNALGSTSKVTVNTGGTLLLGVATAGSNRLSNSAEIELAGGVFETGGFSETAGNLTLAVNSTTDFGSGTSYLTFDGASSLGSSTLTILNWSGTIHQTGGTDRLLFANSSFAADTRTSQIQFNIGGSFYSAEFRTIDASTLEAVPVPEPSTIVAVSLLGALIGWRERSRLSRLKRMLLGRRADA